MIPGLAKLTGASDFSGYLDPYDGMLHESGGGRSPSAQASGATATLAETWVDNSGPGASGTPAPRH